MAVLQEFTTNVTHELKTPLTSILGYSELIEQEMVSGDEIKEISTKIKMNSERLLSMINNVIRLSVSSVRLLVYFHDASELFP